MIQNSLQNMITNQFLQKNYRSDSMISYSDLTNFIQNKIPYQDYNQIKDVFDQLIERLPKNQLGTFLVADFIKVYVEADQTLQRKIQNLAMQLQQQNNQQQINQIMNDLNDYKESLKILHEPFGIEQLQQNSQIQYNPNSQIRSFVTPSLHQNHDSQQQYFNQQLINQYPDNNKSFCADDSLKGLRITALVTLMLCFTVCFGKNTFFGMTVCLGFLYLWFINSIDNKSLKYLGAATLIDILLIDIFWLVVNTDNDRFPYSLSVYIVVMSYIILVSKFVLMIFFFASKVQEQPFQPSMI